MSKNTKKKDTTLGYAAGTVIVAVVGRLCLMGLDKINKKLEENQRK